MKITVPPRLISMPTGVVAATIAECDDGWPRWEIHVTPGGETHRVTILERWSEQDRWLRMHDWPSMLLPFVMEVLASDELQGQRVQRKRAPCYVFKEGSVEAPGHIEGTILGSIPRLRTLYNQYLEQPSTEIVERIQGAVNEMLSRDGVDLRGDFRALLVTAIVQVEPLPAGVDISNAEEWLWVILTGPRGLVPNV